MCKAGFSSHQGTQIYVIDLTGSSDESELLKVIRQAQRDITAQPAASTRVLTDATDLRITKGVSEGIKQLAKAVGPHVKASAQVGVTGMRRVLWQAAVTFSGRKNMRLFDDVDSAKAYLVEG